MIRGRVTYANCKMFASFPTTCMLCGAAIPANTPHECSRTDPEAPPKQVIATYAVGDRVLYKPGSATPDYQGVGERPDRRIPGDVIGISPTGRIKVRLKLDFTHIGGRVQRKNVSVHAKSLIRDGEGSHGG